MAPPSLKENGDGTSTLLRNMGGSTSTSLKEDGGDSLWMSFGFPIGFQCIPMDICRTPYRCPMGSLLISCIIPFNLLGIYRGFSIQFLMISSRVP